MRPSIKDLLKEKIENAIKDGNAPIFSVEFFVRQLPEEESISFEEYAELCKHAREFEFYLSV